MRIWCQLPPADQCDQHLRGEWREIWGLYAIAQRGFTGGYSRHPETLRWVGRTGAIVDRMKALCVELRHRGVNAKSPPEPSHLGNAAAPEPWDDQLAVLAAKGCSCKIPMAVLA